MSDVVITLLLMTVLMTRGLPQPASGLRNDIFTLGDCHGLQASLAMIRFPVLISSFLLLISKSRFFYALFVYVDDALAVKPERGDDRQRYEGEGHEWVDVVRHP